MNPGKIRAKAASGGSRIGAPQNASTTAQIEHPVFCLRHLQKGYDIADCNPEQRAQLIEKLRMLSRITWAETRNAHRHGLGSEKIPRNALKVPLPTDLLVTDDVDFIAFRFAGKSPMIGYRSGPLFRILWLDHNFSAYNH